MKKNLVDFVCILVFEFEQIKDNIYEEAKSQMNNIAAPHDHARHAACVWLHFFHERVNDLLSTR